MRVEVWDEDTGQILEYELAPEECTYCPWCFAPVLRTIVANAILIGTHDCHPVAGQRPPRRPWYRDPTRRPDPHTREEGPRE